MKKTTDIMMDHPSSEQGSVSSFSCHSSNPPPRSESFDDDDIEQGSTAISLPSLFDDPPSPIAVRDEYATTTRPTFTTTSTGRQQQSEVDGVMISSSSSSSPPPPQETSRFHKFFQIKERNTTIRQEFRAATVSFLSLSYVLVANKTILAGTSMLKADAAVFGTALSSAVACFLVGTLANVPFGMVPHLGISSFMVHGVVLAKLLTLQEALTACWLAGLLTLGIGLIPGVFPLLIRVSPQSYRLGTTVGIGIMVTMNALVSIGMIVSNPDTIVALGDEVWSDWTILMCMIGIGGIASLLYHGWTTSLWVGMSVMALVYWEGMDQWPSRFLGVPPVLNIFVNPELLVTTQTPGQFYVAVVTFVFVILYDVTGVGLGLAASGAATGAAGNNNNNATTTTITKRTSLRWTLLASSVGTMVGAWAGSTPVTLATESVTGIHQQGGRTGLAAIFMGLYFLLSILFSPLLASFPAVASVAALVLGVGAKLASEAAHIRWNKIEEAVPAFVAMIMIPLSCNISHGMIMGYMAFLFLYITTGKVFVEVHDVVQMIWKHRQRINNNTNNNNHHLSSATTTNNDSRVVESASSTGATADEQSVNSFRRRHHHYRRQDPGVSSLLPPSHNDHNKRYALSSSLASTANDESSSSIWSSSLPASLRLRRLASNSCDGFEDEQQQQRQQQEAKRPRRRLHHQLQEEEPPSIEASDTLSLQSSSEDGGEMFEDDENNDDDDDDDDELQTQHSAEAHVSPV